MKSSKNRKDRLVEDFEEGRDVSEHFDINMGVKTVNVDLPIWAIKALDQESTRRGVARQALMKMWLIDRLDDLKEKEQAS